MTRSLRTKAALPVLAISLTAAVATPSAVAGPFPGCNATSLADQNLSGCDLRSLDLSGSDLRSKDLSSADLRSVNLANADLRGAFLRAANFGGANLQGANLQGADLRLSLPGQDRCPGAGPICRTNLREANLESVNLSGADIQGADIRGVRLGGANLSATKTTFTLSKGDIVGQPSDLNGCKCIIAHGYLIGAGFNSSIHGIPESDWLNLPTDFFKARNLNDLSGISFASADLSRFDLSGSNLRGSDLSGAALHGSNLTASDLTGATIVSADLSGANLFSARLDDTVLRGANLWDANLAGATGFPKDRNPWNWMIRAEFAEANPWPGPLITKPRTLGPNLSLGLIFASAELSKPPNIKRTDADLFVFLFGRSQALDLDDLEQRCLTSPTQCGRLGSLVSGQNFKLVKYKIDRTTSLTNLDLSDTNLSLSDIDRATLTGSDFSGTDLSNSDLSSIDAGGTTAPTEGASASATRKRGVKLFRAKLTGSNISKAKLRYAGLAGVISGGLKGTPSSLPTGWKLTKGYLVGPKANLTNADLEGAGLSGIKLSTANLTGVRSGGITSKPASLPTGWTFTGGFLIGPMANLTAAKLNGLDFGTANLAGAVLTGADLTGAKLSKAKLTGVVSSGLTGTPASLPTGWKITAGKLVKT